MGAAGMSCVLIGTKSLFRFGSIGCQFERCAIHRTPPLSALRRNSTRRLARSLTRQSCDTTYSRKAQFQAPPGNPETGDRAPTRTSATQQQHASIYIRVNKSEADFHKPGMHGGSVRAWANAWNAFGRTPSRGGRGRRAAMDLFGGVFFKLFIVIWCCFCYVLFLRTHKACRMYEAASCLIYLSTCMISRHPGDRASTRREGSFRRPPLADLALGPIPSSITPCAPR